MKTKFRAWDKKLKAMAKVISLSFYEEDSPHSGGETESFLYYEKLDTTSLRSFDAIELMQYTGLKDSNGVEIYEGDLLSIQIVRDAKKTVTIVFEDGAFGVKDELFGWGYGKEFYPLKTIINNHKVEIIGNIHENKELLEGE